MFGIRGNCDMFWNGEQIISAQLSERFASKTATQPQPAVHIRAGTHAYYETHAKLMAAAAKTGLVRIGFVSEPD